MSKTEKSKTKAQQQVGVMLRQARVGNMSFETFTTPEDLPSTSWNPRLEFKMSMGNSELQDDADKTAKAAENNSKHHKVSLEIEVTGRTTLEEGVDPDKETDVQKETSKIFTVKVVQEGIFNLVNLEGSKQDMVLYAMCPETLFPYVSTRISETVLHAGFPPIYLQPMNFSEIYKQKRSQEKK